MLKTLILAQTIAVVANPSLRPTPVIHANVQYTVAVDSALGGLVIRDLTLPPVTFAGAIRVEGTEPLAREPEPRFYADSVHFGSDGRVTLISANGARPPIRVEVDGGSGSPGGRIRLLAEGWPLNRVMLVTIRPADIHEYHWRSVGYGERDRVRIDNARGMVFLSDPGTGMSVAIGLGRGARGRISEDATDMMVERRFDGQVVGERRRVPELLFAVEPSRDGVGTGRAELVFGMGRDEESAARAAQAAGDAPEGRAPTPRLRIATPEPALQSLLTHSLLNAWSAFSAGWIPASLGQPYPRAAAGAAAIPLAMQMGLGAAVCADYARFRDVSLADGTQKVAVATRLAATGPYRWVLDDDTADGTARESAQILKGYACYFASRDSVWLATELPRLMATARVAGRRSYDDLRPGAFERLAELLEEQARRTGTAAPTAADSLRNLARGLRGTPARPRGEALWRPLADDARRAVSGRYARLGAAEAGTLLDRVARQLFGVSERLDRIVIAPALDGAFDDFTWRLENYRVHDDTLSISYRPASAEAVIRLTALRRRRVQLGFAWMTPNSCVTIRRGNETERPMLVTTVDGEMWFDMRGTWSPAEITVRRRPCDG